MKNYNTLFNILKQTKEWKANEKAIAWFNNKIPTMAEEEMEEHFKRFEEKVDGPLNVKWQQIQNLYGGNQR